MTDKTGRIPPHDPTAEQRIIGCAMLFPRTIATSSALVSPEHFYTPINRLLWLTVLAIDARGEVVDHASLAAHLRAAGQLEAVGGLRALGTLTDNCVENRIEFWATIVRDAARARQAISIASDIAARGYAGLTDIDAYLCESRDRMLAVCQGLDATDRKRASTLDEDLKEAWCEVAENRAPRGLVPTGFPALDAHTGGLWPGLLTILAGRPGMGKSAVLQNIATNAALSGRTVLYLTLEDTRAAMAYRQLARFASVDNTRISTRSVTAEDYSRLLEGLERASGLPLYVEDGSGLSSRDIRSRVLEARDRIGGLDLLVVDHLAEVRDKAENETQAVSLAARSARDLAAELACPALYAHQLSRGVESRIDRRPSLGDLKQSGKVEEVARAVWLLYRDGYYQGDQSRHDLQLIVAKANHGRTGTINLWADLSTMYVRGWDAATDGPVPAPSKAGAKKKQHSEVEDRFSRYDRDTEEGY